MHRYSIYARHEAHAWRRGRCWSRVFLTQSLALEGAILACPIPRQKQCPLLPKLKRKGWTESEKEGVEMIKRKKEKANGREQEIHPVAGVSRLLWHTAGVAKTVFFIPPAPGGGAHLFMMRGVLLCSLHTYQNTKPTAFANSRHDLASTDLAHMPNEHLHWVGT